MLKDSCFLDQFGAEDELTTFENAGSTRLVCFIDSRVWHLSLYNNANFLAEFDGLASSDTRKAAIQVPSCIHIKTSHKLTDSELSNHLVCNCDCQREDEKDIQSFRSEGS